LLALGVAIVARDLARPLALTLVSILTAGSYPVNVRQSADGNP